MWLKEMLATLAVLASIPAVPALVLEYHHRFVLNPGPSASKVVCLTGVTQDGVWTLETVNAGNYWRKQFPAATLYLQEGQVIILRLASVDVHHRFYAPGLNVGPIDVEPGHTEVVTLTAASAGTYRYYCTSMCGHCHFYMSGWIVVTPAGQTPKQPEPVLCPHDVEKGPPPEDLIPRGRYLYREMGCVACHGEDGQGGVENFNYTKKTVPAHTKVAEMFFLTDKEHTDALIELLRKGAPLDQLDEAPDIPRWKLILTQYHSARDKILNGKECSKLDAAGPLPPLQMPSWQAWISDRDSDAIIAYLLSLYPWEKDEE